MRDHAPNVYENDIKQYTTPGVHRYRYDLVGNLTKDLMNGIDQITWNAASKVTSVEKGEDFLMNFIYDGLGHRIMKDVIVNTDDSTFYNSEYYVRDAQGNIMATYDVKESWKRGLEVFLEEVLNEVGSSSGGNPWMAPGFLNHFIDAVPLSSTFYAVMLEALLSDREFVDEFTATLSSNELLAVPPIAQRVMTSSLTYLDFSYILKDLFDDDGNYFWSTWYEGLLSEEGDLMSAMHGRMFDLSDNHASYGAQALMNLWDSQGEEILSRFPMVSEYGGEDTQRATLLGLLKASRHREVMSEVLNHWQMTDPSAHEQWMFGVITEVGYGQAPFIVNQPKWHQLLRSSLRHLPMSASWETYVGVWLTEEWRKIMSPEFVVQCMYAADPFGVIGGEVALAGNNKLVAQVLPQTAGISMESVLSPFQNIPLDSPLETILAKKSISLSSQVLYGSSRLGTMNYLSGQYGMSYHRVSYSERVYDTIGLHGHRPYYSFSGNQLATGGVGSYGQPFWMNQSHSGQHLIGQKQYELSNHLGNVQVTVSDLPYRKQLGGENLYQAALKSVYDYYPFGSLMPGRTVMDTTVHCVDMTQIDRVWQPAYEDGLPFNSLFSEMSPWGAASYELSSDPAQLDLFIEDEQSGIELLLDSGIKSGSLVLEGKVSNITDRGIVLRVQGVTSEGEGVVYHQEHLGQFDGKLEIPLDSAYSHYVVNIQGLLHWSILDNEIVNGHWVEPEVLVRVCDEVGDPYRFGFNGQEKVNEMSGMGNHYTTFFREYDSRIGRWLSPDPAMAKYPGWSPYVFNFNNPILINDPLGDDPPSIKATLIYGQKNSRTFSSLMRINSITGDNYGHFISFGNTTETYNQTGKIKLVKGEDIKWQVVQLAHELTNRSNLKQVQALDKKVSEGKVTPKQYAKQLAQAEVAGQINQVKVAAEIEYRYQGKEYDALNNVINKYANGELTDKDLQKMIIANDEHLGTYESQGMVLRKEYVEKEAKVKQIRNNANKDVGKQKSEAPTPFDISLPGYTR